MSLEEIFNKITATACKNVTFSGGEPFDQADELINLAILLTVHDYHIMAYTGYTFEEIVNDSKNSLCFSTLTYLSMAHS